MRHKIYRNLGWTSALAFEAVIPVYAAADLPSKDEFIDFSRKKMASERTSLPPPKLAFGEMQVYEERIFLPLIGNQAQNLWERLRLSVPLPLSSSSSTRLGPSPIPPFPGIFLSCAESDLRPESETVYDWKSYKIALWKIVLPERPASFWWNGIEWEELWNLSVRRIPSAQDSAED